MRRLRFRFPSFPVAALCLHDPVPHTYGAFLQQYARPEPRGLIYLPANRTAATYPTVYATVGQIILSGGYKGIHDSLVGNKIVPLPIPAGVFTVNNDTGGTEYRCHE